MITEALLSFFLFPLKLILTALPEVHVSIPDNIFNGINSFLGGVVYIVPVPELLPILTISLALRTFKIFWALGIRIKSFIPTMGA